MADVMHTTGRSLRGDEPAKHGMRDLLDRIPCPAVGHADGQGGGKPSQASMAALIMSRAELLLERAGAQEEAGMLPLVFPFWGKRFRGTSNTIAMLPEQELKRGHSGSRRRDERTEEMTCQASLCCRSDGWLGVLFRCKQQHSPLE